MAYGRYRRRRNFRRRGRRYTSSKGTSAISKVGKALSLARTAYSGFKFIRGIVNSELFHKDATYTLGAAQSKIYHLTTLTQGDSVSGRTGNSVLMKTFTANGYMYIEPTQNTNTRVMLALVLDKQQVSDTYPTVADVFTSNANPSTLLNVNTLGRFTILWRKQYTLSPNTAGDNAKQVKIFKRLNFHTRYNGSAETDIQKNGLYLVMITSEPTLYPTINFESRLSYHDN